MRRYAAALLLVLMACSGTYSIPFTPFEYTPGAPRRETPKRLMLAGIKPADSVQRVGEKFRLSAVESAPDTAVVPRFYWRSLDPSVLKVDYYGEAAFLTRGQARVCARLAFFFSPNDSNLVIRSGPEGEVCRTYEAP